MTALSKGSQASLEREDKVVRKSPTPSSFTAGREICVSAPQILRCWLNQCPTPESCISLPKQLDLRYLCKTGCCQDHKAAAHLPAGEVEEEEEEAFSVLVLSHNSPKTARW